MYSFDALLSGGQVINVWRDEDFSVDVEGIEQAFFAADPAPKLLFLTSPNNPDGGLIDHATLRRLLQLPVVVVVDEAYIEFAEGDEGSIGGDLGSRHAEPDRSAHILQMGRLGGSAPRLRHFSIRDYAALVEIQAAVQRECSSDCCRFGQSERFSLPAFKHRTVEN